MTYFEYLGSNIQHNQARKSSQNPAVSPSDAQVKNQPCAEFLPDSSPIAPKLPRGLPDPAVRLTCLPPKKTKNRPKGNDRGRMRFAPSVTSPSIFLRPPPRPLASVEGQQGLAQGFTKMMSTFHGARTKEQSTRLAGSAWTL